MSRTFQIRTEQDKTLTPEEIIACIKELECIGESCLVSDEIAIIRHDEKDFGFDIGQSPVFVWKSRDMWNIESRAVNGLDRCLYLAVTCAVGILTEGKIRSCDGAWHDDVVRSGEWLWREYCSREAEFAGLANARSYVRYQAGTIGNYSFDTGRYEIQKGHIRPAMEVCRKGVHVSLCMTILGTLLNVDICRADLTAKFLNHVTAVLNGEEAEYNCYIGEICAVYVNPEKTMIVDTLSGFFYDENFDFGFDFENPTEICEFEEIETPILKEILQIWYDVLIWYKR